MVNYQLAKIYKIVCNTTGLAYIGSTCETTLARRLAGHTRTYKQLLNGKDVDNMTSFKVIENNNYEIILLEDFPCERRDQLHARERYYIESIDCVNKVIPTRTHDEYMVDYKIKNAELIKIRDKNKYEKYKDKIAIRSKLYRAENQEVITERKTKKTNCVCGSFYCQDAKSRHEKTQKHIKFIVEQTITTTG